MRGPGYDYHPDLGLVMVGGQARRGEFLDMAVATKDGKKFEKLAPLPEKRAHHCAVVVDKYTIIVAGGIVKESVRERQSARKAFQYNPALWSVKECDQIIC